MGLCVVNACVRMGGLDGCGEGAAGLPLVGDVSPPPAWPMSLLTLRALVMMVLPNVVVMTRELI